MSRQLCLVTGANTGLGFQIIRSLYGSQNTYKILVGARDVAKAEKAIQDLASEFPSSSSTAQPLQIDIEDDTSIKNAFEKVQAEHGKVDVLLNNAGMPSEAVHRPRPLITPRRAIRSPIPARKDD